MNIERNKQGRFHFAFTLIEMLTVIAIMAIIAALVVTMGQAAAQKKKIVAVQGEMARLTTMTDNYHNKLNYYPPDNGLLATITNNPVAYDSLSATNPLIYELYGATNLNGGADLAVFNNNNLSTQTYSNFFNRGGVANGDPVEPHNFFQPGLSPKEYAPYNPKESNPKLFIFGLIVPTELAPGNTNNFWHYDSSSPNRHNMNSYDLWAEYSIGTKNGKLTIITNGNW